MILIMTTAKLMLVLLLMAISSALLFLSIAVRLTIRNNMEAKEIKEIITISNWMSFLSLLIWAISLTIPPESVFRTIVVKILPKDWFY